MESKSVPVCPFLEEPDRWVLITGSSMNSTISGQIKLLMVRIGDYLKVIL